MESFFRYISYVDYYRNEERVKNVGFLRWKLYQGKHQLEIQVKDVPCVQGAYEIKERNTGKLIGEIVIDKGIGNIKKEFPSVSSSGEEYLELLGERLYLRDVEGFVISLSKDEDLSVSAKLITESQDTKAASGNVLIEGIEEKYLEPSYVKNESNESVINKEEVSQQLTIFKDTETKMKIIEPIHDNKWKQLCKKYPNVHPFPNDRVFLSIKPEDFIVLQQEYQKLVHNSFLLHGFYNYGHMILGKLSDEENTPVYVGVPGVYYEQEKRAARMFGFVGFESVEHPVQAGSYGYYMIEVEI